MATPNPTVTLVEQPGRQPALRIICHAIECALESARNKKLAIFVYGPQMHEELSGYKENNRIFSYTDLPIINKRGLTPSSFIRVNYYGNSQKFNKVHNFMGSYGMYFHTFGDVEIESITGMELEQLYIDIAEHYVQSRRIKNSAEQDISEYLSHLHKVEQSGPVIFYHSQVVSFQNIIAIKKWDSDGRTYPLVIMSTRNSESRSQQYERQYVDLDVVVDILSKKYRRSKKDIKRHLDYWKATQRQRNFNINKSTAQIATQFFSFTSSVLESGEESPSALALEQRPAPIMFSSSATEIVLDHVAAQGAPASHVRGAARALTHQANDLLAIPSLENAVPRISVKITRLISVLERIFTSNAADEADIIEFGVEFSSIESQLYQSQDRISDITAGDVISFLGEGKKFLARFESWNEYESDAKSLSETKESAAIALEILRSNSAILSLDSEAKQRLEEIIDNKSIDTSGELSREGASRSAENLTAAAGKALVDFSKSTGNKTIDTTREAVSEKLSDSASKFILENSSRLIQFAQSRGAKWIEMLIKWSETQ